MNQIIYYVDGTTFVSNGLTGAIAQTADMAITSEFDTSYELGMESPIEGGTKEPLLSNLGFVIGVSVVVLVIGVGIGIVLGKLKIKKGFDLYED